jgi:hypothetical protein
VGVSDFTRSSSLLYVLYPAKHAKPHEICKVASALGVPWNVGEAPSLYHDHP